LRQGQGEGGLYQYRVTLLQILDRRATEVAAKAAEKTLRLLETDGGSNFFGGKAFLQERSGLSHTLGDEPLKRSAAKRFIERPFQCAHIHADLRREFFDAKPRLPRRPLKFVGLKNTCSHILNTNRSAQFYQIIGKIF
jgi:hypothetical protein